MLCCSPLRLLISQDIGYYLLETILDISSGKLRASLKADNTSAAAPNLFFGVIREALKAVL